MVHTLRWAATLLAALPATATVTAAAVGDDNDSIGINLSPVTYWSSQWVFVDAFRQARPWLPQLVGSGTWNTGEDLATDSNGWPILAPGQAAGTLMFRGVDGHYPSGEYVCLYDGEGEFEFSFDASIKSASPGRIVVDVEPSHDGIYLKLVASNPSNRVRNIRLIMPGFEAVHEQQVFHPLFLERLRGFETLRFMDWQRTNDSRIANWGQRTPTDMYSQALGSGVAIEHMLDLADTVDANPWFCMPHLAGDSYIRQFAELVKERSDPNQKIYVEYSNEVWNTRFDQTDFAATEGMAAGLDHRPHIAALKYYARRSTQVFGIWEDVFGGTDRIVRVLATQAANSSNGAIVMDFDSAYAYADVLAIAPYFGGYLGELENGPDTLNMSVDEILDECEEELDGIAQLIADNLEEACARDLRLISYEGGQHLVGKDIWSGHPEMMELFFAANRHPRMRTIYQGYLSIWRNSGAGEFVSYASTQPNAQSGSWGALEFQDQSIFDAPKYRALRDEINRSCPDPYAYCFTASNSVGSGARIGWDGVPSVAYGNFGLEVINAPAQAPGVFYYSATQRSTPFEGGTICIGGSSGIHRAHNFTRVGPDGVARQQVNFDPNRAGPLRAGTRWNFQYVYFDSDIAGGLMRASDALSVRFCP